MIEQRLNEIITEAELRQWDNNKPVIIAAGTGTGKNYFIEHGLYQYAQKTGKNVLLLVNRSATEESIINRIDSKFPTITYQKLQKMTKNEAEDFLLPYDYIICDEAHYFCNDALFNKTTDRALNAVFAADDAVRVFMSGTFGEVRDVIYNHIREAHMDKPVIYKAKSDFSKFNFHFYMDTDTPERVVNGTPDGEKVIAFFDSAAVAYELYSNHKADSLFICSQFNDDYAKYVDKAKRKDLLTKEYFPEKYLFTTNALNNGVNINDDAVTRIICDVGDVTTLRQCIGRKRISERDRQIDIWIRFRDNAEIESWMRSKQRKIDIVDTFQRDVKEYSEKYQEQGEDDSGCIYINTNGKATLRECRYYKLKQDVATYKAILDHGDYGYIKYICTIFRQYHERDGETVYEYNIDNMSKEDVEKYLYSLTAEGQRILHGEEEPVYLDRDARKDFVKRLGFTHKVGTNKRLYSKIDDLNRCLKDNKFDYQIGEAYQDRRVLWFVEADYSIPDEVIAISTTATGNGKYTPEGYRILSDQEAANLGLF